MKKGEERGNISHFVNELVLTVDGDGEQIIYETPLKYVRPRMCDFFFFIKEPGKFLRCPK